MRIPAGLLAASLLAVLYPAGAFAQAAAPSLDVRQFRPPTDPAGLLYLEPALTPGPGQLNFAALFSYAYRPAIVRAGSGDLETYLVRYQISTDLMANVGITKRGALGVDVPIVGYQSGTSDSLTRAMLGGKLPPTALGDVALTAKVNFLSYDSLGGFGLGAIGRLTLPTGDGTAFVGEGATTGELRMLAEYKLIALSVQATAGLKVRPEERDFAGRAYGSEVPWGAALVVRPQALGIDNEGRMTWGAEVHGAYALPSSSGVPTAVSPALAGLFSRFELGSDLSLSMGVDFGLSKALGNPLVRAVAGLQWAPRTRDRDHDGVDDDHDQCPELAEDRDGFEDDDGCPDPDNDDDGVMDVADKCPTQKEDADGFQDDDGCPDPDNDGDGIPDAEDACPDVKGARSPDPKSNGCPATATPAAPAPAPPAASSTDKPRAPRRRR